MAAQDTSHFLFVPVPAWGHTRPMCHLALRMLDCNEDTVVTILTAQSMLSKTQAEIAEHRPDIMRRNSRIRIITVFESSEQDVFKNIGALLTCYPTAYKTLHEEQGITCATTGTAYDPVRAPVAVLLDFFMPPALHATRALTGRSVPIITWATGSPSTIIRMWGPESLGGLGDFSSRVEAEAKRMGVVADEIGDKMYRHTIGAIVEIPGLPPMYDHEFFAQDLSVVFSIFPLLKSGYDFFHHCDGVLLASSYTLEGESIEGVRKWFSESQKEVYNVGPLLPRTYWDTVQNDRGATDVQLFLEKMLGKYGEKAVVLVSFGSFFWPPIQEYVDEVIEALIEKEIPFILCHASPFATIPPELSAKVEASGLGLFSSWVPQHYVLTHPATGWFLTHGGQGGFTEALASGIPLICWPLDADQPAVAVNAAHNLRVAFELVEVRSGQGLKPLHRLGGRTPEGTREAVAREIREVLDASRGEVGREMRKNAEAIKVAMKKSWDEDGVAMKELRGFVEKMG